MDFRRANRGQALQVGVILLFGFLVVGLAMFQATVVPDQNRGVEFNAYQEATGDVADLRNDVLAAAERGASGGTTVKMGARYPSRTFFVNPGPPATRLETTEPRNVTLSNVSAASGEATNTRRFVDAVDDASGDGFVYRSRSLRFHPDYNEFDGQPMVVTGESAYRVVDGGVVPLTGQTLIQGNRINLVMLDGDVSAGGSEAVLTTDPVSADTRTVTVTGDGDDPIVLGLDSPPGVSAAEWVDSPVGRSIQSRERVVGVEADGDRIRIELDPDERYRLRMSLVEVRERGSGTEVAEPEPAYVVAESGDGAVVAPGQTADVTAEVRDRFNNPVSADVEFEIVSGDATFEDGNRTTIVEGDSDGRATARLLVEGEETVRVRATVPEGGDMVAASTTFDVQVLDGTGGTRGGGAFLVEFSQAAPGGPDGDDLTGVRFEMSNLDSDDDITVTAINVTKTSTDADNINQQQTVDDPWSPEINLVADGDSEGGFYDPGGPNSELDIGTTANLTSPEGGADADAAVIAPEDGITIHIYQFRSQSTDQEMKGEFVEVRITFEIRGEEHRVTTTLIVF